ncbi:MAG: phosphatidylserine/phosphatidylglycerophosphate/cardiolipin synthase [Thiohalocapsa sp. PB-PSB1]|nr:MAG: phosphatidylserine/phosphatidylglycerophosphate/cardiolipin synthase [Thiohalocapsa sp. PB-PSB1]
MSICKDQQPAAAPASAAPGSLLRPGHNCWRIEHANRVSVLVDGEAYLRTMRAACIKARRFIAITAWDIHSRLALIRPELDHASGSSPADDLPNVLGDLLMALLERHPRLEVFILLWKHAPIYAFEREPPLFGDHPWPSHPRLHLVMDSAHPFAASQHQKSVIIDGRIAFCGGIDLSQWRWDTPAHAADEPRRRDPDGDSYPPYHDVHMLVDGDAASALFEQFNQRWRWAVGEPLARLAAESGDREAAGDPWPDDLPVLLRDQRVGIARTLPEMEQRAAVREVEQLYLDTIDAASTLLYIENQYLTSRAIADALCRSLQREQGPDILIVLPRETGHWLEQHTMDILRARMLKQLRAADDHGRLRLCYPDVAGLGDDCMMVHAKLMIADDRILRVASSNLSNRSMGLDSECDLCIAVENESDIETLRALRQRLLGMLMSVPAAAVAHAEEQAAEQGGGLIAALELLQADCADGKHPPAKGTPRLANLEGKVDPEWNRQLPDERLVDPDRPLHPDLIAELMVGGDEQKPHLHRRLLVGATLIGLLLIMAAAWRWTPAGAWLNPNQLAASVNGLSQTWWGPPVALVAFIAASLVAVPVTLLILVSALVFDPVTGGLLALAGSTLSALAGYGIGVHTGRDAVERLSGGGLDRLSRRLAKRGILTMITVRIVPVAPFAILNLFAGASHLRLRDFLIGTLIGMLPAVLAMALFAEGLLSLLKQANLRAVALLLVGLLALGGLAWLSRRWLRS